ncbi:MULTISPECIES: hypothetical protein [Henriciella]|jgi:hypothetical protein|uniref:DUF4760 domain-containing protein n=1 Tax=Henriciella pelagia TaxID=1977912 RepID=A0ABQ1JVT3_9PROT|nr:hypothetical protein [Henriciella pelagia]GGB78709.1 hypothetical protein GCM10011503_29440 [Henriciella pelagia]
MTLEQTYFLAGIISSIAVIASLIFVGFQLRHSANQQRIATAVGYYDIFRDHMKILSEAGMVDLFLRGLEQGADEFEPAEKTRLNVFYTMVTRGYQVMYYQARKKVFEEDFWQHSQNHFRDHLASRYYQSFWTARRHHFPHDFRKLVDGLIEAGPTAPLLEMET